MACNSLVLAALPTPRFVPTGGHMPAEHQGPSVEHMSATFRLGYLHDSDQDTCNNPYRASAKIRIGLDLG